MSEGINSNSSSSGMGGFVKRGLSDWPDLLFAFIPILDREYADIIAMIPVLRHLTTWLPGVHPIYLREEPATWVKHFLLNLGFTADDWLLGTLTAGLGTLLPLDKEAFRWVFRTFGIDFMEDFFNQKLGASQQGSYVNEDGEIVMADGGINRQGSGGQNRSSGKSSSLIKKALMIGGPILIVVFLIGSGYADLLANQAGFQLGGIDTPAIGATVAQGVKTLECVGNVACVRQWQFNNTQRPGSEEVGQEYSLKIENFGVNDGFPLDVANRRADDRVPVDFSVYNPRHGLKGITAQNVAYRIAVYDSVGSLTNNPKCQTGWLPLGGQYADNSFGQNGTILPGGFATPLGTHSELTLKKCSLLQPALGLNRRVKLQMAYDYSSQSTLQVQAMSRQNMLSLEKRPSFKKSQTANTPVKTYVNVESPITYRSSQEGGAESSIFGLRVGFETGQRDIKYRVHTEGFKLYDSSETVDVSSSESVNSNAVTCEDLAWQQKDQYTFSQEMENYLDSRQENSWFKSDSGPSPARCSMILENPGSISPTGETLTFRIDANYTVLLEEVVGGFKVQNSQCTRFECPMLVPQSKSGNGNLISQCESSKNLDANNGCGARYGEVWTSAAEDYALQESVDAKIEEGETAVKWNNILSAINEEMPGGSSKFEYKSEEINSETVVGVSLNSFSNVNTGIVGISSSGDLEFEKLNYQVCGSEGNLQSRFPTQAGYGDSLIFSSVYKANCKDILKGYLNSQGCQEGWGEATLNVATLDVADWFEDTSNKCQQALREYRDCGEGLTAYKPDTDQLACINSGN